LEQSSFLVDKRALIIKLEEDRKFLNMMLERVSQDIVDLADGVYDFVEEDK
jgi:hypothetical protein